MKKVTRIHKSNVNFRSAKTLKVRAQRKRSIVKKLPFLKGRSQKSFEKTADSFMGTANKLFGAIYLSVVALPLSAVIGKIISTSGNTVSPTVEDIKVFFNVYGLFLLTIYVIAIVWAWSFRKTALNLYDSIES